MIDSEPTVACDLSALSRTEHEQLFPLAKGIFSRVDDVVPLPDGFALRLQESTMPLLVDIAMFISLDSRCCPFIRHGMEVDLEGRAWLRLTGGGGVKAYLASEMKALLSQAMAPKLEQGPP